MDTVVTISAYGASSAELSEILSHCAAYEALLSKTIASSDVSRINRANGSPVKVDMHTITVLQQALEISRLSGGAFDITIAPATALWDFKADPPALPDEAKLAAAAALADYTKISIEGNVVTLPAGMMIDLGAIAKGYIADEIAALCRTQGITSGMLNFGGNVVVIGSKPDGSPWRIGIQDPDAQTGVSIAVLPATDTSMVTSGIYERGFDLNGIRYHHILDTATGWPIRNELASISILSESSMLGDALSTACFALGEAGARALLHQFPGVEAVFVSRDREITATEGVADAISLVQ